MCVTRLRHSIDLVEMTGRRSMLVRLYEHWRAVPAERQVPVVERPPLARRICALAGTLGRPSKILAHSQLMRVPEPIRCFLPIGFNETDAAMRNNIEAAPRARRAPGRPDDRDLHRRGSDRAAEAAAAPVRARPDDLPRKNFAYRLWRRCCRSTSPDRTARCFALRAGSAWLAHRPAGGRLNKRRCQPLHVRIGPPVPCPELAAIASAALAMRELRRQVYALADNAWGSRLAGSTTPGTRQTPRTLTLGPSTQLYCRPLQ